VFVPQESDTVVILSVIDNLVKGAAGQAVQNMNLMFVFDAPLDIKGVDLGLSSSEIINIIREGREERHDFS
jgi:hypothetical protein